ncbi:MAG TPA: fatty acid desaturase [Candidatus Saccharimonadales bacterium]|jgi:fatty acid desaturase|nr:fatty acid desaturase [Candidatus Saccharimonadales bacterium]
MKPTCCNELTGREALARRDALEIFIVEPFPSSCRSWVSAAVTCITGLAPSSRSGRPPWKGSDMRALVYMLSMLIAGVVMVFWGGLPAKLAGGVAVVSAMRNFSSSVGHHLTHSSKGLPWRDQWTRRGYNTLSAFLLLPTHEDYRDLHRRHHAYVAGPNDPDQEFIEYLRARFDGLLWFLVTLFNPALHVRFLSVRIRAVVKKGPFWRRLVGIACLVAAMSLMPMPSLAIWSAFLLVGYQVATLVSFTSLHLWGNRPQAGNASGVAIAVTFGRLLIPECTALGLLCLCSYALVRVLWLQGDLNNHDVHHLGGKELWTDAAYVRTHLILSGVPLRQTNGVRAMFQAVFHIDKSNSPQGPRQMSGDQILGM